MNLVKEGVLPPQLRALLTSPRLQFKQNQQQVEARFWISHCGKPQLTTPAMCKTAFMMFEIAISVRANARCLEPQAGMSVPFAKLGFVPATSLGKLISSC